MEARKRQGASHPAQLDPPLLLCPSPRLPHCSFASPSGLLVLRRRRRIVPPPPRIMLPRAFQSDDRTQSQGTDRLGSLSSGPSLLLEGDLAALLGLDALGLLESLTDGAGSNLRVLVVAGRREERRSERRSRVRVSSTVGWTGRRWLSTSEGKEGERGAGSRRARRGRRAVE